MPPPNLVLLGCPKTISGGPEAIHQLAQMINQLGVRAEVFYGGAPFEIKRGSEARFIYEPLANNPVLQEYAHYDPISAKSTALSDRTLVILPEIFPELHEMFAPAVTAYWWLGWDAAFRPGSRLADPGFQSMFFARADLWHIAQTFRAHVLLQAKGVRRILDAVDYVDPRFTATKPKRHNDVFRVAFQSEEIGASDLQNGFSITTQTYQLARSLACPRIRCMRRCARR